MMGSCKRAAVVKAAVRELADKVMDYLLPQLFCSSASVPEPLSVLRLVVPMAGQGAKSSECGWRACFASLRAKGGS